VVLVPLALLLLRPLRHAILQLMQEKLLFWLVWLRRERLAQLVLELCDYLAYHKYYR
jgi:hypothetical protein